MVWRTKKNSIFAPLNFLRTRAQIINNTIKQYAKQRIRKDFCDSTDTGLSVLSLLYIQDPQH